MASGSPKKIQRVKPPRYTTCLLYNTEEAVERLKGLSLALCNPSAEKLKKETSASVPSNVSQVSPVPDLSTLTVSNVMSCNFCSTVFANRLDQKRHYRSDWHRYNLKQRLKGRDPVDEEQFAEISGNISSLSGSDSDNDSESDLDNVNCESRSPRKLVDSRSRLVQSTSSTDSESDSGNQTEDASRRLPKVYFRNHEGQILSVYRCVLYHKKCQPARAEDLIQRAVEAPEHTNWAVFMTGGGHFAAAIFAKEKLLVHKTFHRYVVRAKRGTAQSSRDSQGNAPKSAGSSLRRYNEAALQQEIQDLIASWANHLKDCDRIFLRAPSFNRKIFFGGKNPPLQKGDERIRLIPFQTRRPTFNEVRRVYELLASIECYGDEAEIQDLVPITPPQVFNPDTGQLSTRDENTLSPRQLKLLNRKLARASPLATQEDQSSTTGDQSATSGDQSATTGDQSATTGDQVNSESKEVLHETESAPSSLALPEHVRQQENMSSGASTCSDTELVEYMETINLMELKEHGYTKKPKRRKKSSKQRRNSFKCQNEPESNVLEEERYHLKNSLYTACKVGDFSSLKNLLAIFCTQLVNSGKIRKPSDETEAETAVTSTNQTVSDVRPESDTVLSDKQSCINSENVPCHTSSSVTAALSLDKKKMSGLCVQLQSSSVNPTVKRSSAYRTADSVCDSDTVLTNKTSTSCDTSKGTVSSDDCKDMCKVEAIERSDPCKIAANEVIDPPKDSCKVEATEISDHQKDSCKTETKVNDPPTDTLGPWQESKHVRTDAADVTDNTDKDMENKTKPSKLLIADGKLTQPDMSPVVTAAILNETIGDSNTTLLHVAAKEGHKGIVTLLMASGADPAVRDKTGQTPYMVSKDKTTRNEFRKFMASWPERYNYEAAQIPAPLTEDMETERKKKDAEKKKAQRKAKQERQKTQREEDAKKAAEDREKQRFLNLSDREKRALAAEKRLLTQVVSDGGSAPVLVRCFQCGADMTGRVPFQYFDNKFCTSKCLQVHRRAQTKS